MKLRYLLAGAALLMLCIPYARGQESYFVSGQLYTQSMFSYTDIMRFSQFNNGFGTARSAAMGGAFTSLGADLSSMYINPAGLGMYRSSEFGFTPMVTINKMEATTDNGFNARSNSKTRFTPSNIGLALNLFESSGALTSFTFGVGYNRLADFNHRSTQPMGKYGVTIGDLFVKQLYGYDENELKGTSPWYSSNMPISNWGAALGYGSNLIDPKKGSTTEYTLNTVHPDAVIDHYMLTKSEGGIGEYAISGGFNFQNKFYMGFTLGLQSIYFKQTIHYYETFSNNQEWDPDANGGIGAWDPDGAYVKELNYRQMKKMSGTGVNLKAGFVYRPIPELRIGVAVHTPTWGSVEMEYGAEMENFYNNTSGSGYKSTPYYVYDYDYATPTRLLTGISYSFGSSNGPAGIISLDYERTWYNGMRYTSGNDFDETWFKEQAKHYFKGGDTFRAGLEFKPVPLVSLRGGFSWSGNIIDEDNFDIDLDMFDSPVMHKNYSISGGVGFRLGRASSLDLTYYYTKAEYTGYNAYYMELGGDPTFSSPAIDSHISRHNIMASLSFRF